MAPSNPDVLFTNARKSTDGGHSWQQIAPVPYSQIEWGLRGPDDVANKIAIHPLDPDTVFAALSAFGLYRTSDGGASWQKVLHGPTGLVCYHLANPQILYVAGADTLFKSIDGGDTWIAVGPYTGYADYSPKELVARSSGLFLLLGQGADTLDGKVLLKSIDDGFSWVELGLDAENTGIDTINSFAVAANTIYVATNAGLEKSADIGTSWQHVSGDYDDLSSVDVATNIVVGSARFGVSLADSSADGWKNIGIVAAGGEQAQIATAKTGTMVLQTQGGLYKMRADTTGWQTFIPPHDTLAATTAIGFSRADTSQMYSIYGQKFLLYDATTKDWHPIGDVPEPATGRIESSELGTILFARSLSGQLLKSTDAGSTWTLENTPTSEHALDLHFSSTGRLYLLTDQSYYVSSDLGHSWQALQIGLPDNSPRTPVIDYDANADDRLFAFAGGKIFEKPSASLAWQLFPGPRNLDYPVIAERLVAPAAHIGEYYGVLQRYYDGKKYLARMGADGTEWLPIASNMDSLSLTNFEFTAFPPHTIYHMKSDGTIWFADLESNTTYPVFAQARLQLIHNAPDPAMDSLDIYLNGVLLSDNLPFGEATPFFNVPANTTVQLGIAGKNSVSVADTLRDFSALFLPNTAQYASINGVINADFFENNPDSIDTALNITLIAGAKEHAMLDTEVDAVFQNGIVDAPALEIVTQQNKVLADSLVYGSTSTYVSLSAGRVVLDLRPQGADSTKLGSFSLDLSGHAGEAVFLAFVGFLAPVASQDGADIRLIIISPNGRTTVLQNMDANPGVPTKVKLKSPANNALAVSTKPALHWNRIVNATHYRLQIDTQSAFATAIFDKADLTDTVATISGLAENQTYYWRVSAVNQAGSGEWSSIWRFTTLQNTLAPATPVLFSPENRIENMPTNVTLVWHEASRANSYTLEVATNATFTPGLVFGAIADTLFTLGNLQYNTSYFWHVKARNGAGSSPWSGTNQLTTVAAPAPLQAPVAISPPDSATGVFTATTLRWRASDNAVAYSIQLATDRDFALAFLFADLQDTSMRVDDLIPERTYYWRAAATSSEQTSVWSEASIFTTMSAYPEIYTLDDTLVFPSQNNAIRLRSTDYRLVGLPGDAGVAVSELLSGAPEKDWRVFWDNGEESDYLVPLGQNNEFEFTIGKAFWLLHDGPVPIKQTVRSARLDSTGCVSIPLHTGWNLITNPFGKAVAWSRVQQANGVSQPIWSFHGTFSAAQRMEPLQGYYFLNTDDLAGLKIPFASDYSKIAADNQALTPDWHVDIAVALDRQRTEKLTLGSSERASDGLDNLDCLKPHSPFLGATAFFRQPEGQTGRAAVVTDFRHRIEAIGRWDFTVVADDASADAITFAGIETLPAQFQIVLFDHQNGTTADLHRIQRYPLGNTKTAAGFTILVGNEAKVAAEVKQLPTRRESFQLRPNFPNPFNAATIISFAVPKNGDVSLKIYDTLGRLVAILHDGSIKAGNHRFAWDGTGRFGEQVASGLYFYRLTSTTQTATGKMLLIR